MRCHPTRTHCAAQVIESRREASLSAYVADQLEYSKLWRLLEFGDKLEKLLQARWQGACGGSV